MRAKNPVDDFIRGHSPMPGVPVTKPNSSKDPSCTWAWCTLNLTSCVKPSPVSVVRKFVEGRDTEEKVRLFELELGIESLNKDYKPKYAKYEIAAG
ncbi:hypothetical protein AVEN_227175-1 [Araneus ventricosus]|uniref:Uncharacterized protein n=1 Tax=Araneus ventricosus TaxID=182803 RepID=A0A4Y2BV32_ARAVE|nr:hypothetical protein AVEN_227175-1 [Araneus ventricosus]